MLLELQDVAAEVGGRELFRGVTGRLGEGQRVALTGPNGIGKTTLLRIICGELAAADGRVVRGPGLGLGYLPQDIVLRGDLTLWQYALGAATGEIAALERRLRRLEVEIAGDPARLAQYGQALTAYEQRGGYLWESRVRQTLRGLGFAEEDERMPAVGLSGGQKVRLELARLLLEQPDILLLDEPTNHLDLPAMAWLEATLREYPGGVVAVSHDRAFLRAVATSVWDFSPIGFQAYDGGYDRYREHLGLQLRQHEEEARRRAAERARLEAYVRRYKAGNRATQAHDRERKLDRLGTVQAARADGRLRIRFEGRSLGERELFLQVEGLTQGYPGRMLWRDLTFRLKEGGRLGIVGRNGSGKTTPLECLRGAMRPERGQVLWASGARLGYLAQEVTIAGTTALDAMLGIEGMTVFAARRILARHLIGPEQVEDPVGELSGGERSRLALAVLVAQGANVLLLDEPTNHLDLPAQEALEEALSSFAGTLVLISHDRALLERVTDRWLWLEGDGGWRLTADFADLLRFAEPSPVEAERAAPSKLREQPARDRRVRRSRLRAEVSTLERRVAAAEGERLGVEQQLAQGAGARTAELATRLSDLTLELEGLYAAWQQAQEALEAEMAGDGERS